MAPLTAQSEIELVDLGAQGVFAGGDEQAMVARLRHENAALRKALSKALEFQNLAYRDPLTGLRNRRYFDERLDEEIRRARRTPNRGTSLVVVDVEDFKAINDARGHQEGDETLQWVGRFLEASIRSLDVCCRLGGDEFVLILCDTDADGAGKFLIRLRERLESANRSRTYPVSLSLGVSTTSDHQSIPRDLFAKADDAMYRNKRHNKASGAVVAA